VRQQEVVSRHLTLGESHAEGQFPLVKRETSRPPELSLLSVKTHARSHSSRPEGFSEGYLVMYLQLYLWGRKRQEYWIGHQKIKCHVYQPILNKEVFRSSEHMGFPTLETEHLQVRFRERKQHHTNLIEHVLRNTPSPGERPSNKEGPVCASFVGKPDGGVEYWRHIRRRH